jgi:hypothetical protein
LSGRDQQRARVYAWEDRVIAPRDSSVVPFAAAQGMVDAIWRELGLSWPPRVEPLPARATRRMADATRLTLRLPARLPSWCLLHELAHALTSTHDGASDGHATVFMGVYVGLLARYLRLDRDWLLASLADAAVAVDASARPVFVDG